MTTRAKPRRQQDQTPTPAHPYEQPPATDIGRQLHELAHRILAMAHDPEIEKDGWKWRDFGWLIDQHAGVIRHRWARKIEAARATDSPKTATVATTGQS